MKTAEDLIGEIARASLISMVENELKVARDYMLTSGIPLTNGEWFKLMGASPEDMASLARAVDAIPSTLPPSPPAGEYQPGPNQPTCSLFKRLPDGSLETGAQHFCIHCTNRANFWVADHAHREGGYWICMTHKRSMYLQGGSDE
jgi:hypothetical protein